jgi:hypothetical protein
MRNASLWPLLCAGPLCTTTAPAQPVAPACQSTVGVDHAGIGGSSCERVATLYALLALPVKVFVAFGGKEGDDPAIIDKMTGLIRQVESNFRAAGYDDSNFRLVLEPDASHTESAWAARLPAAFTSTG